MTLMMDKDGQEVSSEISACANLPDVNALQVGGMIFQAFREDQLDMLKKDRKSFLKTSDLTRGSLFQPWMLGKMRPVGSRMPSGGRVCDTYTVYPGMAIEDDPQKVKKLFQHAKVVTLVHNEGQCH